jgi:methylenetetrahydrofolate dehydrogenase (NADP+)/methenyltetrahydrofolate cyclohydrolase
MQLLDGNLCAKDIREEISKEVISIKDQGKRIPHLVAVLVGDDGASKNYVAFKARDCDEVGFESTVITLSETITENDLLKKIAELNNDISVDGFIVQLPLPRHIDETKIILSIDPIKDVDGFCPENVGNLCLGLPTYISATPNGIMELLKRYNIETEGKHCVVLGRSNIVGTPISILMSRNTDPGNATVTIAHSRTKNLHQLCASRIFLL